MGITRQQQTCAALHLQDPSEQAGREIVTYASRPFLLDAADEVLCERAASYLLSTRGLQLLRQRGTNQI
eukprot:5878669-Amphidinium_carterae.1